MNRIFSFALVFVLCAYANLSDASMITVYNKSHDKSVVVEISPKCGAGTVEKDKSRSFECAFFSSIRISNNLNQTRASYDVKSQEEGLLKTDIDVVFQPTSGERDEWITIAPNNYAQTRLYAASRKGDENSVNALIARHVDVSQINIAGWTALMGAAQAGYDNIVKILIESGAQVNQSDNEGRTALNWASHYGANHVVETLIKSGADVNHPTILGWTPLMVASYMGYEDVVQSLIAAQANVNYIANDGTTALTWAKRKKNKAIVEALVKAGAKNKKKSEWEKLKEFFLGE